MKHIGRGLAAAMRAAMTHAHREHARARAEYIRAHYHVHGLRLVIDNVPRAGVMHACRQSQEGPDAA